MEQMSSTDEEVSGAGFVNPVYEAFESEVTGSADTGQESKDTKDETVTEERNSSEKANIEMTINKRGQGVVENEDDFSNAPSKRQQSLQNDSSADDTSTRVQNEIDALDEATENSRSRKRKTGYTAMAAGQISLPGVDMDGTPLIQ